MAPIVAEEAFAVETCPDLSLAVFQYRGSSRAREEVAQLVTLLIKQIDAVVFRTGPGVAILQREEADDIFWNIMILFVLDMEEAALLKTMAGKRELLLLYAMRMVFVCWSA